MDPPLLNIETTFSRLKTDLYEQKQQLTWNEKLKHFDNFCLTLGNLDLFDKAISTRLPQLANGKRDFLGYLDLVNSNNHNFPSFDNDAVQRQDQAKYLRHSEVPEYTQCARERCLQVNYEPGSMPSKSSGTGSTRPWRHLHRTKSRSSPREISESPNAHNPSRSIATDIVDADLDNDAEDERESLQQFAGEVLPSIEATYTTPRRNPNIAIEIPIKEKTIWDDDEEGEITGIWSAENDSRKNRREKRERKAEVIDLEERDSPPKRPLPKAHKERSVGVEGGEVDAHAPEHNQHTKTTHQPWYPPSGPSRFPLVPEPLKSASATNPPGGVEPEMTESMARVYGNKRRVFNGGVKPTNKLGQQFSVLIPQKPPKRTVDKAFDLTHGLQSSNLLAQPHHANKRQRTNGRASESTPSSPPSRPIDVEDSTPRKSQTNTALSKTRRGGRKDGNISEYSSVEDTVNPRKGTSGINPITSAYFQLPVSMKHSKPDEDNDDPISDSDMTPDRRNWKKEKISRLPSPTYKGTRNPTIARRLPPGNGQRSSNSKLLLRHQDDMNKKPSAQPAKRKHSVGSADELAAGHEGKKNTSKKENSEAAEAAVLLNAVQGDVNGVVHLDDTDDEKVGKKADIPSISKKPKRPAKKAGGITFQVTEAFSTVAPYKMKPGDRWFFICYTDAEVCRLIDGDGEVKDEVLVASILAVQWSKDSAKMSLPRRVDGNTKRQSTIFLELGSNDESADLVEQLCKLSPTLPLTPSPAEQLDKVFSYQRGKTFQYKQNQPRPPADITVLEKKAETRQAQRRAQEQDLKQRGSTKLTASQQPPQVIEPQRAEGLRRRMGNSANGDTIAPNDFYNKSSNHGADHSPPLLARRNPARNRKEIGYQERIRSPTPPPVARWTVDNPGWEERWLDTIVYPPGPGHKRTATVDLGDIERLDDEQFLNDSVVNFYLRYLEYELEQSRPEVAKRMYFQNSFFYERLTTPAANGKKGIDYKAVQRWTKGVDLFSKDYIIVPVCENLHWYVAIICNAPALLKSDVVDDTVETKTPAEPNTEPKEDAPAPHTSPVNLEDDGDLMKMDSLQTSFKECLDLEKPAVESPESHHQIVQEPHETNPLNSSPIANIVSDLEPNKAEKPITTKSSRKPPTDRSLDPNTPRIIILDSLGGGHLVTSKNLRDYLVDEMKDKHGKDVNPPRQMHFAAKNLDVQKNYSDCGLFLLSYIQKFLESPDDFISGILRHERVPSWINPSVLRKDIREHLFNLQRQSPKKPKRGSRAVLPKLAPRPTQTEPLPSPPGRTAEQKSSSNGVALPPTNACTNTTDNPKIITRSLKPAAPGEASAQMTKPTASRNHRGANGTAAKEVVDLANGTDSERTPAENSRLPASSSSKGPTHSRPTDEDHSSTLHDLTGSSQVVIQKKPEHGAKKNTFVGTMIESVNGFMGLGQAAGGKDDAKDLGNSVSSPVEIPDSPAKSDIRRENNQQKSRRRRPSVEEVSPSKRQRSSPSGPRDFFSRYPSAKFDDNEILEDEVPEPPSPGLHNPNFGQKASELSSVRTIRKNGSQSPDDQNGDDREMLLLSQATNACTSAKKSSSPSPVNIQKQRTPSPMLDLSNMREDNEEESAAPVSPGFEVGSGHPRSQKSLQGGLGTHTHF